ncbi:hypothetical protein MLD38_038273 [Melastoma candidum]|uniref:Uncharacterized protein n=1 Tax=Melastoma candidum TaxID=119954 RepID=A0ACB9KZ43_9MYRT|nr:hypothetical protein MLD38_038273 [Melastoma candidum]
MEVEKVEELKRFVEECKSNPSIIHDPSLSFFKSYLQSLGARIPSSKKSNQGDRPVPGSDFPGESAVENDIGDIVESDIELDEPEVQDPDDEPPQKMGDPSIEVTEEDLEAAQAAKMKAMDAISEGRLDEGLEFLTEAITLNPKSAILYATRANAFVKLKKPYAAIRDADAALQINPDSAKGYKARGMARAMLGKWEDAASDLHLASNLDYDEEIGGVLKKVEHNSHKIEEHRRKYERLRKDNERRKAELEQKKRQAAADRDAVAALKEGQVIGIHSRNELDSKLKAASRASRLAILYFTATWCGPCRVISPIFTSLAEKYPKAVFLKVDIDEARDAASAWNISSVPTFFFLRDGKEVDRVVGADKNTLERKIAQLAK